MDKTENSAKWIMDDYDECGRHYICSACKSGIIVRELLGKWTPDECPECGAKMDGVKND